MWFKGKHFRVFYHWTVTPRRRKGTITFGQPAKGYGGYLFPL